MKKIVTLFLLLLTAYPVFAVDPITIGYFIAGATGTTVSVAFATAAAFAINMVISSIITKAFFSPNQPSGDLSGASPNPGNRQQIPPATDNKLPVVYGTAYVGGIITDLSITANNQVLYYVFSLCEVTDDGNDLMSFGNIYWGGKRVIFDGTNLTQVNALLDESTGFYEQGVQGKLFIYLYRNGSNQPVNTTQSAIQVLSDANLTYKWDNTKLMTNTVFAIVRVTYNPDAGTTGLVQTKFQVTNSRTKPGDCIYDYLTSETYGGGIDDSQIDNTSLTALNTYSDQLINYTTIGGITSTLPRFRFDGVVDTSRSVMTNLQDMSTSCDCLIKFNEITAQWGVIVQQSAYTVDMALSDSNIISGLSISPFDIASTYNIIECKFPDQSNQDAFNTAVFDLAAIAPGLLFPNEPINKQSLALSYVNNNVRAQYLAIRMLKASREDLQVSLTINFVGLQLEAGNIVSVTNSNYGWVAKLFRINKITEKFSDDGSITATLQLTEFNPSVYDEDPITEFEPLPNTGLYDPLTFDSVPAPIVIAEYPSEVVPFFVVQITGSASGIIQYAEIYYSAFTNPTTSQLIFAGTTAIQSDGNPYTPGTVLPLVTISDISQGNWYFFARMVNGFGSSQFSAPSAIFRWRPTTFQYTERYLGVAYADTITGTGFTFNPRNKEYYGLRNQSNQTLSSTPSLYTWYLAEPNFGTEYYLAYANRNSQRFSFDVGTADYAAGNGAFVPTLTTQFDIRVWSALPDGTNIIDLTKATGQVLVSGATTVGDSSGEILVSNNPDGKVIASLKQFLDFGPGVYSFTGTPGSLTIDIFGRVVGFENPDPFYYTRADFSATASQTVFTVTRNANYIQGQCFVFQNGILLEPSEYTDTNGATGTVTLGTGATLNNRITIISFRSVSSLSLSTISASGNGTTATIGFNTRQNPPFVVGETITVAGVTPAGYNGNYVVTACTNNTVSYASATTGAQTVSGTVAYRNNTYRSFKRTDVTLTNASSYTSAEIVSGYEQIFLNGVNFNDQDYNIVSTTITDFPAITTGRLTLIRYYPNNLGVPNGSPVLIPINTVIGQVTYPFSLDSNSFNLYSNGSIQIPTLDYTTGTNSYTLINTPTTIQTIMNQQTFARTGAV